VQNEFSSNVIKQAISHVIITSIGRIISSLCDFSASPYYSLHNVVEKLANDDLRTTMLDISGYVLKSYWISYSCRFAIMNHTSGSIHMVQHQYESQKIYLQSKSTKDIALVIYRMLLNGVTWGMNYVINIFIELLHACRASRSRFSKPWMINIAISATSIVFCIYTVLGGYNNISGHYILKI